MPLTKFPNGVSSFGSTVYGGSSPTMGREFHVRKTTDTGYEAWKRDVNHTVRGGGNSVHTSIESALSAAKDFDTIWVYPGQWKPSGVLAITQDSLRIAAVQSGPHGALTRTEIRQYGNDAVHIFTVNAAHNVEIAGFRLTPYDSGGYFAIMVGDTADTYGFYAHDNYFYCGIGGDPGSSAVSLGVNGSHDCDSFHLMNNRFYLGGDKDTPYAIVDWNQANRGVIRDNVFQQQSNNATNYAIKIDGSNNHDHFHGEILDNRFVFVEEDTALGVCVAIKNPTGVGGSGIIDGNVFVNYYDNDKCIASNLDINIGINYDNATAIGAG